MQKARIKLASIDINKINDVCTHIKDISEKTGVEMRGPIPLPTKKLKVTTRRGPDGGGTSTWERYEMRVHKRVIDLGLDERALRLVMRVPGCATTAFIYWRLILFYKPNDSFKIMF